MARRGEVGQPPNTAEGATPVGLPRNALSNVADVLNAVLADSFVLFLKTKNFHWHVSGPHFRDHHLMLGDQNESAIL